MKHAIVLIFFICTIQLASAAHFIVGTVGDSLEGEIANGKEVVLWGPSNGIDHNLTDVIGTGGNSGADNIYMIDCELLSTPCVVGDEVKIRVMGYPAYDVNLSVTGAGFDVAPNITLNSRPNVTSILVDDAITSPANEIDLIAASTRNVVCEIVVEEYDKDALQNSVAEFYHSGSYIGDWDDNNSHYTNASCFKNEGYGTEYETKFLCGFDVLYYAGGSIIKRFKTIYIEIHDKSQEKIIALKNFIRFFGYESIYTQVSVWNTCVNGKIINSTPLGQEVIKFERA